MQRSARLACIERLGFALLLVRIVEGERLDDRLAGLNARKTITCDLLARKGAGGDVRDKVTGRKCVRRPLHSWLSNF
ncbi:MAG: hypothetical protein JWL86_1076 [Rhizobium sp.]|nr:hypothetical protein [Rhizobium sp.]